MENDGIMKKIICNFLKTTKYLNFSRNKKLNYEQNTK